MGRQYNWRYRCPKCGRPYAKKTLWVRHIAACKGQSISAPRQKVM